MIFKCLIYFLIGIFESFGISLNMKFIQRSKKILTFITAVINIIIWGLVLISFIDGIERYILLIYAIGFGYGEVLGIQFDNYLEKLAKMKGLSFKKRLKKRRIKR